MTKKGRIQKTPEQKAAEEREKVQIAVNINAIWGTPGFQLILQYIRDKKKAATVVDNIDTTDGNAIIRQVIGNQAKARTCQSILDQIEKMKNFTIKEGVKNG